MGRLTGLRRHRHGPREGGVHLTVHVGSSYFPASRVVEPVTHRSEGGSLRDAAVLGADGLESRMGLMSQNGRLAHRRGGALDRVVSSPVIVRLGQANHKKPMLFPRGISMVSSIRSINWIDHGNFIIRLSPKQHTHTHTKKKKKNCKNQLPILAQEERLQSWVSADNDVKMSSTIRILDIQISFVTVGGTKDTRKLAMFSFCPMLDDG